MPKLTLEEERKFRTFFFRGEPQECWLWLGKDISNGYASFYPGGYKKSKGCHRFMYELEIGVIPSGYIVHHTCGVRLCVNPAHLVAMRQQDHMKIHDVHRLGNMNRKPSSGSWKKGNWPTRWSRPENA